jgi:hypothetical protein
MKLDAKDLQSRRLVFWTMYTWDCWSVGVTNVLFLCNDFILEPQSILNARATTFRIDEVQCSFPEDRGYVLPNGEVQLTCVSLSLPIITVVDLV